MKAKTKNIIINAMCYALMALIAISILCWTFWLGEIKGMAEAHKAQLKEQIRLLEQRNEKIMEEQIKAEMK